MTTTVTCTQGMQAYARLSGAVGLVLRCPTVDPALGLEVIRHAYADAEHLATGNAVTYPHGRHHDALTGSDCHDPPAWNAIPG